MAALGRLLLQILGIIGGLLAIAIGLVIWFVTPYYGLQLRRVVEVQMASAVVFVLLGLLAICGSIIYNKKPMLAAKLLISCGGLGFLVLYELDYFFLVLDRSDYFSSKGTNNWLIWVLPGIFIISVGIIRLLTINNGISFPPMPSDKNLLSIIIILASIVGFNYLYGNYEEIFGPENETFCKFDAVDRTLGGSSNNSTEWSIRFKVEAKKDMYSFAIIHDNHSSNIAMIGLPEENLPGGSRRIIAGQYFYPIINIKANGDPGWIQMRIFFIDIDAHEKYIIKRFELDSIQTTKPASKMPGFDSVQGIEGIGLASMLVYLLRRTRDGLA